MTELDQLAQAAHRSSATPTRTRSNVVLHDFPISTAIKFGFWAAFGAFLFSLIIWVIMLLVLAVIGVSFGTMFGVPPEQAAPVFPAP